MQEFVDRGNESLVFSALLLGAPIEAARDLARAWRGSIPNSEVISSGVMVECDNLRLTANRKISI
jgi:hypothetical protein